MSRLSDRVGGDSVASASETESATQRRWPDAGGVLAWSVRPARKTLTWIGNGIATATWISRYCASRNGPLLCLGCRHGVEKVTLTVSLPCPLLAHCSACSCLCRPWRRAAVPCLRLCSCCPALSSA